MSLVIVDLVVVVVVVNLRGDMLMVEVTMVIAMMIEGLHTKNLLGKNHHDSVVVLTIPVDLLALVMNLQSLLLKRLRRRGKSRSILRV